MTFLEHFHVHEFEGRYGTPQRQNYRTSTLLYRLGHNITHQRYKYLLGNTVYRYLTTLTNLMKASIYRKIPPGEYQPMSFGGKYEKWMRKKGKM
jgi:hypothetical protein